MSKSRKKRIPKRVLALPDLEQAKSAVLNTLTFVSGQRTYDHAINDFVEWYCSEPRLAFNRTVVPRYRIYLEQKGYAPNTINLPLAAVRRVASHPARGKLLPERSDTATLRGKRNHAILAMLIACGLRRGELLFHETQADVFVVESGQATLVVGGKLVDGKTTAPHEMRGSGIAGETERKISTGDVVSIPAKVPHHVKVEPGKEIMYFVVKVTQ